MAIRDILVHIDNSATSVSRLDVAIAYARKHGARLRGLYLITHHFYEPRAIDENSDREKAERQFYINTSAAGVEAEWIFQDCSVMGSNASDLITSHAYYTDLVVLGQVNQSHPIGNLPTDIVERVIMSSGRPVLVIPYSGSFKDAGERIMIAWKAGRESIRAVNDALPILQKAHSVVIVEGAVSNGINSSSLGPATDYLLKHSINVTIDIVNSDNFPVGDMLLNNVCEKKIDLLVMGAFAPNRRGTLKLSPVALHVLKHLTAPVLMSH
jgi:nucleotide-binding universal stress UspA family protein